MGQHQYQKGFTHPTKRAAQSHAAMLRRQEFGIMKRKVYRGTKVQKEKTGGFTVLTAESKGYLRWLRTGRS
jgi:SOS-response transcriptional repressor LexA